MNSVPNLIFPIIFFMESFFYKKGFYYFYDNYMSLKFLIFFLSFCQFFKIINNCCFVQVVSKFK